MDECNLMHYAVVIEIVKFILSTGRQWIGIGIDYLLFMSYQNEHPECVWLIHTLYLSLSLSRAYFRMEIEYMYDTISSVRLWYSSK